MDTLRRLAHTPTPRPLAGYRLELLALVALLGGLVGQLTGAY